MKKLSIIAGVFILIFGTSFNGYCQDRQEQELISNSMKLIDIASPYISFNEKFLSNLSDSQKKLLMTELYPALEKSFQIIAAIKPILYGKYKNEYEQLCNKLSLEEKMMVDAILNISGQNIPVESKVELLFKTTGDPCAGVGSYALFGLWLIYYGVVFAVYIVTIPLCIVAIVVGAILANVCGIIWIFCIILY